MDTFKQSLENEKTKQKVYIHDMHVSYENIWWGNMK